MKISRVLMFHGTQMCNNTLNIFADDVADSLKSKGIDVGFVDLNKVGDDLAEEYIREMNHGFDAAIAFNSCGQHETTMEGRNIYEYMHVPFYNWILDHPCEHVEDILSDMQNYHIICIDRDHVNFVKRYFPLVTGVHFIPLGGYYRDLDHSHDSFLQRKYKVIFTGSVFSLEQLGKTISELPPDARNVAVDMIEYMIDDRTCTNEMALRRAMQNNNIETGRDELRKYAYLTRKTNPFMRTYVREEIMRYLAQSGLEIDVFGSGWESIEDRGKLRIHNPVSYEESVSLCSESKICLNIMPLFRDGMHDRIPTAMLSGAAVMTDSSGYIEQEFVTNGIGKELYIYDASHPEMLAQQLSDVLKNEDDLYAVACRGLNKAEHTLTWDKRVDELIGIMESR